MSEELELMKQILNDVSYKLGKLASDSHEDVIWRTNTDNSIKEMSKKLDSIAEEMAGDSHTPGLKTRVMIQENRIDNVCKQLSKIDAMHSRQDSQDVLLSQLESSVLSNTETLAGVRKLSWTIITAVVTGGITLLFTLWSKNP